MLSKTYDYLLGIGLLLSIGSSRDSFVKLVVGTSLVIADSIAGTYLFLTVDSLAGMCLFLLLIPLPEYCCCYCLGEEREIKHEG